MEEELKIEGMVEEIIFSNDDNGYTVCVISSDDNGVFTATGYMPQLAEGEYISVIGEWTQHASYGEQFKVGYYEKVLPSDEQSALVYLSSGIIPGIRETTAKHILAEFGTEVFNVMLTDPKRLSVVKGISEKKALEIGKAFGELQYMQTLVMFLQRYNISPNLAAKVYKAVGDDAVERIRENPYILSDRVNGITFKTCDRIAAEMNLPHNNPDRIRAGIKYLLTGAAYTSGHTYLPRADIVRMSAESLGITREEAENGMSELIASKDIFADIIGDTDVCYLCTMYTNESRLARKLTALRHHKSKYTMSEEEAEEIIQEIEKENDITLAPEQREAVFSALESGVMVLTGGPGTGKTTTINTIIAVMESLNLDILLAAPTGRAAKRLREVTGRKAQTIHRLLKAVPGDDSEQQTFEFGEGNPLEADVIIIDEMSMVDVSLMSALLSAVPAEARVILSGDADQLPSVGAGNVLHDIIACGDIPVTRLEKIFRQAEESLIVVNAHNINRGVYPDLRVRDNNFFFLSRPSVGDISRTIAQLCAKRLPDSYGVSAAEDIQVLSPMKKGEAGVINLNKVLQECINPPQTGKREYQYGHTIFREGDKVMQTRNDYDLVWEKSDTRESGSGVFNGDMGLIQSIDTKGKTIKVMFDEERLVEYDFTRLDEIELSYAVTVHKSQGSEFPIVVMAVYRCAPMLMCRNLFYTAVTRAKSMVVLVGDATAVYAMVDNNTERERYSGLRERINRESEKIAATQTAAEND